MVLQQHARAAGLKDIEILVYNHHPLPPMFSNDMPETMKAWQNQPQDPRDWRGFFTASAMIITGVKS
jgi:hypothetical protein